MENDIVILDVGGYKYKTTISTLTKFPHTYFNGLFSGKYPIHKQQDGSIFIDRDGKHFRYLLNFLRNGRIVFPENESDRRELMLEAEFYLLKDFILAAEVSFESISSPKKPRIRFSNFQGNNINFYFSCYI
jgi:hypothetical protein